MSATQWDPRCWLCYYHDEHGRFQQSVFASEREARQMYDRLVEGQRRGERIHNLHLEHAEPYRIARW